MPSPRNEYGLVRGFQAPPRSREVGLAGVARHHQLGTPPHNHRTERARHHSPVPRIQHDRALRDRQQRHDRRTTQPAQLHCALVDDAKRTLRSVDRQTDTLPTFQFPAQRNKRTLSSIAGCSPDETKILLPESSDQNIPIRTLADQ